MRRFLKDLLDSTTWYVSHLQGEACATAVVDLTHADSLRYPMLQVNGGDNHVGQLARKLGGLPLKWVPLAHTVANIAFANCDGPLASGTIVVTKAQLDAGPVRLIEQHPGIDGPAGCGQNSLYETEIWLEAGHG